jgi:hypothetical protein
MELDKFVFCECGKKKKIQWINKTEFNSGKSTFCVGVTECSSCQINQEHYAGNIDDIQNFVTSRGKEYQSLKFNLNH